MQDQHGEMTMIRPPQSCWVVVTCVLTSHEHRLLTLTIFTEEQTLWRRTGFLHGKHKKIWRQGFAKTLWQGLNVPPDS